MQSRNVAARTVDRTYRGPLVISYLTARIPNWGIIQQKGLGTPCIAVPFRADSSARRGTEARTGGDLFYNSFLFRFLLLPFGPRNRRSAGSDISFVFLFFLLPFDLSFQKCSWI
jgi:hypothetical protein